MSEIPDIPSLVQAEQTVVHLPSRPHWIEPTVDLLCRKAVLCGACQESRSKKLMVALQEALANAVIHGNLELSSELKERADSSFAEALAQRASDPHLAERLVDIVVDYDGQRCRWIITDQGKGFDVDAMLRRIESDDPEVLLSSGRGILIMRSFLDEVQYESGGRRLILTLYRESGDEKRQHPRLDTTQPVRIAPIRADGSIDWDAAYQAISVNLSEQGIGLLQERLASTDRIIIGIYSKNQPIYIPAEVRHCRSLGSDMVELGCRFQTSAEVGAKFAALPDQPAAEEAIHEAIGRLLDKQKGPPAGSDERRVHPRVPYNAPVQVHHAGLASPITGFARDLAHGGIAFVATVALPEEDILVVLPQDEAPPLHVRARVIRCNKIAEGFYDIGARFLQLEDVDHA